MKQPAQITRSTGQQKLDDNAVQLYKALLADYGWPLLETHRILDFGCGAGSTVHAFRKLGYQAMGCDIKLESPHEHLRLMEPRTERIPFPDESFDFVYSRSVMEHVQAHARALPEIYRVMRSGAIGLHFFPSKWRPIEAHVYVPLAGVIQQYSWLLFWAFAGIRNEFQIGKSASEVAKLNCDYLRDGTHYLSRGELTSLFASNFRRFEFAERKFFKHSPGGSRRLASLARILPGVAWLYSTFSTRVIVLWK